MVIDFSQYPHFLYYTEATEATRNKNGSWIPGGISDWKCLGPCRYEPNGQAAAITTTDGKMHVFSGIVYMPRNTEIKPLPIGTRIAVSKAELAEPYNIADAEKEGDILIIKPNATFEVGRLHNRMWL